MLIESLPRTSLPPTGAGQLSDAVILRSIRRDWLEAGRVYARQGRVRRVARSEDGRAIAGEVQGRARRPYRQTVKLVTGRDGDTRIASRCTCPVGGGCKHVAAVLIALRREPPPLAAPAAAPQPSRAAVEPPLPGDIAAWLDTLRCGPDERPAGRRQIIYVLTVATGPDDAATLAIAPWTVQLRKDGTPGSPKFYLARQVETPAGYLQPADRIILRRLARLDVRTAPVARDDDAVDLLRRVIATGRARWGDVTGREVAEGPPRDGSIGWALRPDGSQRAVLTVADGITGFGLPEPWYAEVASGLVGPVETGLPAPLAGRLLAAPAIPAEAAPLVAAELARRLPAAKLPPPVELAPPEVLRGPPVPRLRLFAGTLPFDPARPRRGSPSRFVPRTEIDAPLARLSFQYGPVTVPHGGPEPPATVAHEGRLFRVARQLAGERAAAARLGGIGFATIREAAPFPIYPPAGTDFFLADGTDWLDVMTYEVPALREAGWRIDIDDDFPLRIVAAEEVEASLQEGSGIDWLELHLGVVVDGARVDLVPALVRLIADGLVDEPDEDADGRDDAPFLVPLPDGRLLHLPRGRILPTLRALMELYEGGLFDGAAERIAFSRHDAAELAHLEETSGLPWQGGEALRALGRQLRAAGGAIPPVALPPGFKGALRPYQAEGVAWLQFLRGAGLGGVLADDMGLGKTVQALAHLLIEHAEGRFDRPALVVCPTSLIPNWTLEAARFAPGLRVLPLHGPARRARFGEIAAHHLVITTYPLLARDHAALTAQEWHAVILDEAQTIKNPNAETTRQALRLRAGQRLCLSGTPLQNHLGELWSLFDFLAPGFLGDAKSFRTRFRTPIEKHGDEDRQAALNRRVRPFLLRRTKAEVVRDLPPKTEITEPVEMAAAQRAVYEAIRLAMHARVKSAIAERGLARSGIIILDALLKMRQACCDPRLLKMKTAQKAGSAKLERLMELLDALLGEGRRVLVFSQFTSMLALIEQRLAEAGHQHVLLTGDTTDRTTPVRRFQAGEVPLFLISLKAGGVGLNLTAADTVIHYDPWWNPAAEDQATDRAHRIGQEKKVFVHRLVTLGTIEEKMETLKGRKRALVASVLDAEHGGALKMTEADVEALFGAD